MLHDRVTAADEPDWSQLDQPLSAPCLETLDFLGRMPVPLLRGFSTGLDRAAMTAARSGHRLTTCFLMGNEWYAPFADLVSAKRTTAFPRMIASPLTRDLLSLRFQRQLREAGHRAALPDTDVHPAVTAAGLDDPTGMLSIFAVIPWVFLVDHRRLGGRPLPRCWQDLLDPIYEHQIVFGGWRSRSDPSRIDCNDFLLLNLQRCYGSDAPRAFAANAKTMLHNTTAARIAGTEDERGAAIYVLPWMQADICPRRDRTSVIWPEDGAMVMPIGFSILPQHQARLQPLIDFVRGDELGTFLAMNRYPPTSSRHPDALPRGATLKWLGWDYVRSHDIEAETALARQTFFASFQG